VHAPLPPGLSVPPGGCVFTPTVIPSLSGRGVTQLACGEHHTVCLTSGGAVLSCGRAAYGRLGRPAGTPLEMGDAACATPAVVDFPGDGNTVIVSVVGLSFATLHTPFLDPLRSIAVL